VREYWLIDRFARTVIVHRPAGPAYVIAATLGTNETLTSPLLPGFACPVRDLFADLPPAAATGASTNDD